MRRPSFKQWVRLAVSFGISGFVLDRSLKHFSRETSVFNDKIAFSLPFPKDVLLFAIILIILLLIFAFLKSIKKRNGQDMFGFLCIIAGALSNLIDRFLFHGVVDYISIWIFPVFNLADVLIVLGVSVILLPIFFRKGI